MVWTLRARTLVALGLLIALTLPGSSLAQPRCAPSRADVLGPMYEANAPERARTGEGFTVAGTVRSAGSCAPIAGAKLEWWSVNLRGEYDAAHRATQTTGTDGAF